MSYGIELINDYGERAVEYKNCLYVTRSGTCGSWPSGKNPLLGHYNPLLSYTPASTLQTKYSDGTNAEAFAQFPMNNRTDFAHKSGIGNTHFHYGTHDDPESLLFYEMNSKGITYVTDVHCPYTDLDTGLMGIVQPFHTQTAALPWVLASTARPNLGNYPEKYGMQLFDAAGNVVFDSREPVMRIVDHIDISKNQMEDVIKDGQTIDFSLRKAVSDPYVCMIDFESYTYLASGSTGSTYVHGYNWWMPRLYRTNSTTLRMERARYSTTSSGITGGQSYTHRHKSALILVAEMA